VSSRGRVPTQAVAIASAVRFAIVRLGDLVQVWRRSHIGLDGSARRCLAGRWDGKLDIWRQLHPRRAACGKCCQPVAHIWPTMGILARVPEVCAHPMRGLHASLAIQAGASPDVVAGVMGHESSAITMSNYAVPGSAESAMADRAASALLPN